MRRIVAISATVLVALGVLGVPLTNAGASPSTRAKASGTVDVLYAGSFLDLMEQQIDPAFHKATGYTVSGYLRRVDGSRDARSPGVRKWATYLLARHPR